MSLCQHFVSSCQDGSFLNDDDEDDEGLDDTNNYDAKATAVGVAKKGGSGEDSEDDWEDMDEDEDMEDDSDDDDGDSDDGGKKPKKRENIFKTSNEEFFSDLQRVWLNP